MTRTTRLTPTALALPVLGSVVLAFAAPPAAFAQGCTGAPGASAIQQYCEAVPRADGGSERPGGSDSGGSGGGSGSGGSGSGVSSSTAKSLSEAGADGAAVERLTQGGSTSETPKAKKKSEKDASSTAAGSGTGSGPTGSDGAVLAERVEGPADPDGSPLKAATNAVASGPTAGTGVVWGLVGISVLGAGAAVFFRRRGDSLVIPDDEA